MNSHPCAKQVAKNSKSTLHQQITDSDMITDFLLSLLYH